MKTLTKHLDHEEYSDRHSWLLDTSSSSSFFQPRCHKEFLQDKYARLYLCCYSIWPDGGRHALKILTTNDFFFFFFAINQLKALEVIEVWQ